eukprot:TRINITY_DN1918_c0_g1_i1.p1 TRINITY_DN1918_c0_g1~~TRINITY_DN1918_c0_g1_i1.p1  ORF type:complete len:659 (+),score=93.87 TRINITY_DN1918_c0_g1_i1:55-2031(+)
MARCVQCFICVWSLVLHATPLTAIRSQASDPQSSEGTETFPEICDPNIVNDLGTLIDEGEDGSLLHPGQGDDSVSTCTMNEVQEVIAASGPSTEKMWKALGLPVASEGPTNTSVSCMQLCKAVEAYLRNQQELPPSSDVGCYKIDGDMHCDLDFRPAKISELIPAGHEIPDFHDAEMLKVQGLRDEAEALREKIEPPAQSGRAPRTRREQREHNLVSYETSHAVRHVARMFRIFPPSSSTVERGSVSALIETGEGSNAPSGWGREVQKTSEAAQAYLSHAIRQFRLKNTKEAITKWYGRSAYTGAKTRMEVQRVLNSVMGMLDNVAYHYDTTCESNVFAYVYPSLGRCEGRVPGPDEKCTKNSEGKFVFYLCDLYMKSGKTVQIETLLHEGSHHATAFTKDVCMDEFYMGKGSDVFTTVALNQIPDKDRDFGRIVWVPIPSTYDSSLFITVGEQALGFVFKIDEQSAVVHLKEKNAAECKHKGYERGNCAALAKLSAAKALRNADNFCYYIADVNTQVSAEPCQGGGTHGFCVGDVVVYTGPTTSDGHGQTIRSNHQGVVQFSGQGFTKRTCGSEGVSQNLQVGDLVEMCKTGTEDFAEGTVRQTSPLKIEPNGWGTAYDVKFLPWDNVYLSEAGANVKFEDSRYAMFVSADHLRHIS